MLKHCLKISILLLLAVSACAHADEPKSISSTMIRQGDENVWVNCPAWDWSLVPVECRFPGFNCVPSCGKWPGDKWDIGAMQYIPGQTSQKPWGDWKGIPFKSAPGEMAPVENFRIAAPPPPTEMSIIGVKVE